METIIFIFIIYFSSYFILEIKLKWLLFLKLPGSCKSLHEAYVNNTWLLYA